jgi:hypothetical protein
MAVATALLAAEPWIGLTSVSRVAVEVVLEHARLEALLGTFLDDDRRGRQAPGDGAG